MLSQLNGATQPKMIKSLFGKYTTAVTEEAGTEDRKMIVPILVSQFTLLYVEFGTCKQATNTFNVGAREGQARIINCPFSCVLSWSKATGSWRLRVRNAAHNHEPSGSRSMHWREQHEVLWLGSTMCCESGLCTAQRLQTIWGVYNLLLII